MADITKFTTNKQAQADKKARADQLAAMVNSGQD